MLQKKLDHLLEELEIYQETYCPEHIREKEIRSICKAVEVTVAEIRQDGKYGDVTNEQQEKIEWCYNYLIATM